MGLFQPENAYTLQRLYLFDISPQAIEYEFRAGNPVDDFIIQDAEAVPEAKALNLNLQQGINRLFDFVLDLTRAAETKGVFIGQEYSESGGVP